MPTFADVFRALNTLKEEGIVGDYALGGATAILFYAEPTRTYDVDVFVVGGATETAAIHGVPVQFLPSHNALAGDAVATARTLDYEGVPVRVIGPEHLAALAFQAGGGRRRERAWQLIESGQVDRAKLATLLEAHGIRVENDGLW